MAAGAKLYYRAPMVMAELCFEARMAGCGPPLHQVHLARLAATVSELSTNQNRGPGTGLAGSR